jgi:hypothetical protein
MRCQHVADDTQCRFDASRRVLVAGGDPPDPDQSGFEGTIYMVQVCKEHDLTHAQSMPLAARLLVSVPHSANVPEALAERLDVHHRAEQG